MDITYRSLAAKLDDIPEPLRPAVEGIIALDFTLQKDKFVQDPDFTGWTPMNVEAAECLYKNYLFLLLRYPDEANLPPSNDIDDFWHGHILDTRRYTDDCGRIFGRILHHNPYFGYGSPEEEAKLTSAFDRTQELHEKEFCAPIYEVR